MRWHESLAKLVLDQRYDRASADGLRHFWECMTAAASEVCGGVGVKQPIVIPGPRGMLAHWEGDMLYIDERTLWRRIALVARQPEALRELVLYAHAHALAHRQTHHRDASERLATALLERVGIEHDVVRHLHGVIEEDALCPVCHGGGELAVWASGNYSLAMMSGSW